MPCTLHQINYRTLPTTDPETHVAASAALNDWLSRQPGFAYRTVVRQRDDSWSDLIFYTSAEAAQAANAAFAARPEAAALMAGIDKTSISTAFLPLQTVAVPAIPEMA